MLEKFLIFTIFFAYLAIIAAQDIESSAVPPRPSANQSKATNQTKCYTCDSPSSCQTPKTVICDQNAADSTHSALTKYFANVSDVKKPEFECVKIKYVLKKTVEIAVSGCVNFDMDPCKLKPLKADLASASKTCNHCNKSLCNPAGTFSSSSVIIMSAMCGLLLLKSLHF